MMVKRKTVITNNREIYEKFNMLHFSNEVVIHNVKQMQIQRILDNINKNNKVLSSERLGNSILIKKIGIANFNIYYK